LVKKLLTKEVQARLGNLKGHPITINLSFYLSLSIVSYHLLLPRHFYPSLASIYLSPCSYLFLLI
jgi:hypothetical protein